MKRLTVLKRLMMIFLSSILISCSAAGYALADEVNEEAGEDEEGEEREEEGEDEGDGEVLSPEEALAALETVTPSSIGTNIDGKYLALTFPASEVPKGFAVKTVDYQGAQVMLAYITCKSSTIGAEGLTVYLAYLTDEGGSNGEFYLCDTTENARMSDMIKIDGVDGNFIIVLDPGDNVVGPDGFSKHKLQWGSKTATAWSLPEETVDEEEDKKETEKSDETAWLFTKVYAAELNLNAGEAARSTGDSFSAGDKEEADDSAKDDGDKKTADDDDAMVALDAIAHTNASGLIQAQPKEFCLLYAVDESGNLGFYLYDIERGTYQRYVDIPKGESKTLIKYRKLSRTRLFIIIVLAIILVILMFILVNTLLNRRGNVYEEDEEDPEEEAMRKRAKVKERKNIGRGERAYLLEEEEDEKDREDEDEDFEDDYSEEDDDDFVEEEEEYEEEEEEVKKPVKPVKHRSITRKETVVKSTYARKENLEDTGFDWKSMEITAGLDPKKTRSAMEKKPSPKVDLDEDFDFEFLNIRK